MRPECIPVTTQGKMFLKPNLHNRVGNKISIKLILSPSHTTQRTWDVLGGFFKDKTIVSIKAKYTNLLEPRQVHCFMCRRRTGDSVLPPARSIYE